MKKKIAYSSLFLMLSFVNFMFLFFIYGDIKLKNLEFAGEKVHSSSYKIIERYIVWNNKQFLKRLYIKNQEFKYFSYIDNQIESRSLPADLRYIPHVESSLNPNAVSADGAVGFWQIHQDTGRAFGMEIHESFDERYDMKVSTSVALEYLISLHDLFGSRTLTAAAYQRGENALVNDIGTDRSDNVLAMNLAPETRDYLFKILAYKYGR